MPAATREHKVVYKRAGWARRGDEAVGRLEVRAVVVMFGRSGCITVAWNDLKAHARR